jgi:prevent-host-death family protein
MSKPIPIGAYEAKTHLPRLLREVEAGQSFTISVRGRPVAELRPVEQPSIDRKEAVRGLLALMDDPERPKFDTAAIKAMVEDGRR